tara:strand:+ start:94 stop:765 length:672 start_codon:yes stop_codon:yes gene_type:complete
MVAGLTSLLTKGIRRAIPKVRRTVPEVSQKTQLGKSTIPTYKKVEKVLNKEKPKGKILDFGAGKGIGAKEIKADTFEPYPIDEFKPNYRSSTDIPTESYEKVSSLNVLNVLERADRDKAVLEIARILKPNGVAIITTRGSDVLAAKGTRGTEPMSIITSRGTYQKGFVPDELIDYIQNLLGSGFIVTKVSKLGKAAVKIQKGLQKYTGGMVMRNPYEKEMRPI